MAYAAITCLMRTLHQSMELTGCDLQLFYEKLESLRTIMEKPWKATDDLEALTSLEVEMAELAYSAEDMVDSESRKVFLAQNVEERSRAMWELFFLLEQALECMKQWMATWDSMKDLKPQAYPLASIPEHAVEWPENIMVGHETEFEMMLDQLARGERELEVVSIVGMGGIGKTTLATKLYSDPHIMSHFDIRAKATVSQEHCARNVLLSLLSSVSDEPYDELADRLQKLLKGKRYLVVIDDIWTTGAWDDIRRCFPDYNNGSRILLTTRNVEVVEYASSGKSLYQMRLLSSDESWNLLHRKVFVQDSFSPEFEKIGKQIALKCGGLPLVITVIAGLLSKIGKTLDEWQSVAENVSSLVSADVDVQCMRVLALSYHYLPHHLKPCFLYFAIFPEDSLILVDRLVELWAVEGFLNVEEMKSIEEIAEKCLKDLTDRSLISIRHLRFEGKIESCGMHDVIRELCLREARNMNFVNVFGENSNQNPCAQSMQCSSKSRGRISIRNVGELAWYRNSEAYSIITFDGFQWFIQDFHFKIVRVLDLGLISFPTFPSGILHCIHLRYLALRFYPRLQKYLGSEEKFPSSIIDIPPSISSLCYLQQFKLHFPFHFINQRCRSILPSEISINHEQRCPSILPSEISINHEQRYPFILPSEILTMPQLRQLQLDWNYLRNHGPTWKSLVLKNLQCLSGLNPWYCTRSAFRLFPNLKKLKIQGVQEDFLIRKDQYDFGYLDQLEELEFSLVSERYSFFLERIAPSGSTPQDPPRLRKKMPRPPSTDAVPCLRLPPPNAFPQNLTNLALTGPFSLPWKDLSIVGKLPKLESLKLSYNACGGEEWEVAEEGFPHLKFFQLNLLEIRYWRANSDHFPCLERLFLKSCRKLEAIPHDFAEITTLELIDIEDCLQSVENSAKQIQQDIQDNYGGSIEVHSFHIIKWSKTVKYIASSLKEKSNQKPNV